MPQSPWPHVAWKGFYTKTLPLHPTRKLLESRVTLNNIFNTLRWTPSA